MRSSVTESVTRRGYWLGVGGLMLILIVLAAWAGLYHVEPQDGGGAGPAVENVDPVMQMMYSPLGMGIVLLVLQFLAANVLFWLGVGGLRLLRRGGDAASN